ncbi:hypothetical protein [Hymenobacter psychrotolerans]|uniref:Uncharacterized protein n=1 Tax=Hymenobacter psychrotolerans DSM 18569 TaxID=1121959 RepID=A0A1M6Q5S7_9BACT|nr:hypothetical protein [Hymenobacter psychrotolerans]SHK15629.1 hypothetical protein SAMN02746009_00456 [Hymenobacter psychrotolerans DSM 18569]
MKRFWEPGLGRTILFAVSVVSFVIGTYQTVQRMGDENALRDNYWLFMISFSCVMLYRYLKPDAKPQAPSQPSTPPAKRVPRNKRRD